MARKDSAARKLLAIALTLPLATLAGYLILEFLIHYVLEWLSGSTALDDLMVGYSYLIASFLLGCILTVLNWRKTEGLIDKYGIPGLVDAEETLAKKKKAKRVPQVSVSLLVNIKDRRSDKITARKVFVGMFPIERIQETLSEKGKPKVSLKAKNGRKLVLSNSAFFKHSHDLEPGSLFVKLIRQGKVVFHLETLTGKPGDFVSNSDTGNSTCTFQLSHLSAPELGMVARLQFFGTTKDMRKLFFY